MAQREAATRNSFAISPSPKRRQDLPLFEMYSPDQMRRIRVGFVPSGMDDRWFIYFADGWLHIHRSWTGHHIFALQFDEVENGSATLRGGWVNRDPEQYTSDGLAGNADLALGIIEGHLLAE